MPVLIGSIAAVAMDAYDSSTGGTTFCLDGSYSLTVIAQSQQSPVSGLKVNPGDELFANGTLDTTTNVTYDLTIDKTRGNCPFGNLDQNAAIPRGRDQHRGGCSAEDGRLRAVRELKENDMNFDPQGFQPLGRATEWTDQAVRETVGSDYTRPARSNDMARRRKVAEAARLMADAMEGTIDPFLFKQAWNPTHEMYVHHLAENYPGIFGAASQALRSGRIGLRETMSYSDYSALTVDILDRMLYGYYTAAPIANMPLVKEHPLRDFRLVARYTMDGATLPFSRMPNDFPALVPHGAGEPPTQRAMQQAALEVEGSTQRVTYQPQLYQGSMSVNWRALVNDDLGIFRDMIQRLAISGNRTIYSFITGLYASAGG